MRMLFCCLLASLLLTASRTQAQTQPLRVTPPAVANQQPLGMFPIGRDIPPDPKRSALRNAYARSNYRRKQRYKYRAQQQADWCNQANDQAELAQCLDSMVSDSIKIAYDSLTRLADRNTQPDAVAAYHRSLLALEAARAHIKARIVAYQVRELYCRFQAHNTRRVSLLPVSNRYETSLFFNAVEARPKAEFLNQATTVINPKSGKFSLYNELFGDYVGWWRVGVGTTLVASNQGDATTTEQQRYENAVQRLIGGGGNILLSSSFPIAYYHSFDNVVAFRLLTTNNFATDLPQANSASSDLAYHSDIGFDLTGYYRGSRHVITPFVYARLGRLWGNSLFYDNLNRSNNEGLTVGQVRLGIDVQDIFQVAGSFVYGSSFIRNQFPFAITLTVKPNLVAKD